MNDEAHDLTVTVGIPVFNGKAYFAPRRSRSRPDQALQEQRGRSLPALKVRRRSSLLHYWKIERSEPLVN